MNDIVFSTFEELLKKDKFKESFLLCFKAVLGDRGSSCEDIGGTLDSVGITLSGEDAGLTYELIVNTLVLIQNKDKEIVVSDSTAYVFAKRYGKVARKGTLSDTVDWFCTTMGLEQPMGVSEEAEGDDDETLGDELKSNSESIQEGGTLENSEENTKPNTEPSTEKEEKDEFAKVKDDIKKYYNQFYKGVVSELAKRYTSLFESGYEVVKPDGVLSESGLLGLTGNSLKYKKNNVATRTIYNMLQEKLNFLEMDCRSNVMIADSIYEAYSRREDRVLYFPYKLLEYAYGRKAPSGDNKNSKYTFEVHSSASNWSAYCKSEIYKSLMAVVGSSVVKFIYESARDGDYYDDRLAGILQDYLVYLKKCLSVCLLMVDFKSKTSGVDEDIFAFKLRVCDPEDRLGGTDITHEIIRKAFMGATGDVPFTYKPRIESEVLVKEYAHEFNHDSAQAMPLFAYNAFLALRKQHVEPTWNNMILGMFEDGTILKNGKRGVSLNTRLTHHICAGSRAGKGVMTLNILASGIYSNRNVFYLDRKPDMSSMMKYLSPSMFVVNGASYDSDYDKPYYTLQDQDSYINPNNIPDYVCEVLDCGKSWLDLGDIFYMRALKLVMGIIMARGDGKLHDPNFGGNEGVLLVADEFKNFQEGYAIIIEKFKNRLPAKNLASDRGKLSMLLEKKKGNTEDEEYKELLNSFNRSYNDGNYYSLSYLNSMVKDLEFLSTKRDAGFNPEENRLSDIFVIGQHLGHGDMDLSAFKEMLTDGRYKGVGNVGVKSGGNIVNISTDSFGYSIVSFKTCDAFFGRNMEDGREVYLAQTNSSSKSYGRLDDKASNFAYMDTFTNEKRMKIVGGRPQDNIALANSCVFFKPFLVLNDAQEGDSYTEAMFKRCAGDNLEDPWVSREEIIAENPNDSRTFLNEAVGFEGYLKLMGIPDYADRLAKSGDIANYVVQECLGYTGNWLEFITDLRPEWLFSIKDVVDGAKGSVDIVGSSVLSEFVAFNPSIFGLGGTDSDSRGYSSISDYMDEEQDLDEDSIETLSDAISSYKQNLGIEENIEEYHEGGTIEDEYFYTKPIEDNVDVLSREDEIDSLLKRLKALGVNVDTTMSRSEVEYEEDENYGGREKVKVGDGYKEFESADCSELEGDIEYSGGIESYEDLLRTITNDVLTKFGGLGNIVSLKVIGGSLVINGYYYRCRLNDLYARGVPYDVKREINSGSVCRLFDYSLLRRMPKLRDLEFDSSSFVYDYVSRGLGFGSRVSVDLFFNDLSALQCLSIGGKLFKRNTYKQQLQEDDTFYQPRLASRCANYSNALLKQATNSSWGFTKRVFNDKDYGVIAKTLGVTGGLVATGVTGGSRLALKGGRRLTRKLSKVGRTIKGMLDESKYYK